MAYYPTLPNINLPQTSTGSYTPTYSSDSAIGQLIGQLGQYLAPQQQFTEALPYETYAAPQREVFNLWEQQAYRPEFEYFTLDPFKRQYANMLASSGMSQMGSAQDVYNMQRKLTEQPYYNQLNQMQNAYEDMIRSGYNQQMQDYYNAPTAFNNIGTGDTGTTPTSTMQTYINNKMGNNSVTLPTIPTDRSNMPTYTYNDPKILNPTYMKI